VRAVRTMTRRGIPVRATVQREIKRRASAHNIIQAHAIMPREIKKACISALHYTSTCNIAGRGVAVFLFTMYRVDQSHIHTVYIYMVFLAEKTQNIRSYMVYIWYFWLEKHKIYCHIHIRCIYMRFWPTLTT